MGYIDAEKLISEIERLRNQKKENLKRFSEEDYTCSVASSIIHELLGNEEVLSIITFLQQEQPEVDLEKFTEKIDAWKARYNYPDNIPIKAAMAFTARMFYQYPNVARLWYEQLPKATMD